MPQLHSYHRPGARGAQADIDLDRLRAAGYARAGHPAVAFENIEFGHADGHYRFPEKLSAEPDCDAQCPLQLLTLVRGRYMHSQIPEALQQGVPQVWVSEGNPSVANLDPDRSVYLVTSLGAMQVRPETAAGRPPGMVLMRWGRWRSPATTPT